MTGIDLQKCTDAELVQYQLHDNDWYVRHARRLLQERAAAGTLDKGVRVKGMLTGRDKLQLDLVRIMDEDGEDRRRLLGLWALHAIGALDESNRNNDAVASHTH